MIEGCAAVEAPSVSVEANLRIARGLDYYTGTVVEIFMEGYERLKSVCCGGRYDALATDGKTTYPGVGVSFGVSRSLLPLLADGVLAGPARCPARCSWPWSTRRAARGPPTWPPPCVVAASPCEVAPSASKFGKQIRFAERRGIPCVWFPGDDGADTRSRTSGPGSRSRPIRRPGPHPPRTCDRRC